MEINETLIIKVPAGRDFVRFIDEDTGKVRGAIRRDEANGKLYLNIVGSNNAGRALMIGPNNETILGQPKDGMKGRFQIDGDMWADGVGRFGPVDSFPPGFPMDPRACIQIGRQNPNPNQPMTMIRICVNGQEEWRVGTDAEQNFTVMEGAHDTPALTVKGDGFTYTKDGTVRAI